MKRYLLIGVIIAGILSLVFYYFPNGDSDSGAISSNNQVINLSDKITFSEVSEEVGLNYVQSIRPKDYDLDYLKNFMPEFFSGGVAVGDYNNDGWMDVYVTKLDDRDKLFKNIGGKFVDASREAGLDLDIVSNKASWGDIDNDQDLDLLVSTINDRYYLFINYEGVFSEEGIERGLGSDKHQGFGVDFGDYNNDGWIDIKTSDWSKSESGESDNYGRLFINNKGKFEDVTDSMNVRMKTNQEFNDLSFESRFVDLDNDGLLDLIVAADFGNSKLYWNSAKGGFIDGTLDSNVGLDQFGMGIAVGDYDNDGLEDFFVSSIYCRSNDCMDDMEGNKLYHNLGERNFEEVASVVGVDDGDWGWETEFFDYDLDGDLDLIMARGMKDKIMGEHDFTSYAVVLWRNEDGKFVDVTGEVGMNVIGEGRDIKVFDFDKDGDLDIFVARNGERGLLFRNEAIV